MNQNVLKKLKSNKSGDPLGYINEIFKFNIAGSDLRASVKNMCNSIKEKMTVPDILQIADITCLYKGKGAKNDLANERGIFGIPRLKQILEKLIYEDKYDTIDHNMSDSNAGERKRCNGRNHLFIVYGIINYALKEKKIPIDLQIYDIEMCFDKIDLKEALNYLWDSGVRDDKFALLYELNKKQVL